MVERAGRKRDLLLAACTSSAPAPPRPSSAAAGLAQRRRPADRAQRALRARSCAPASSSDLASQMVQVTSEAKASPIITALTTISAAMNMPQGDRSCGRSRTAVGRATSSAGACGATSVCGWCRSRRSRNGGCGYRRRCVSRSVLRAGMASGQQGRCDDGRDAEKSEQRTDPVSTLIHVTCRARTGRCPRWSGNRACARNHGLTIKHEFHSQD